MYILSAVGIPGKKSSPATYSGGSRRPNGSDVLARWRDVCLNIMNDFELGQLHTYALCVSTGH